MENYQFWTLVGMLVGGFTWVITWLISIDYRLNDLTKRVTVIEAILFMMKAPLKRFKEPKADP